MKQGLKLHDNYGTVHAFLLVSIILFRIFMDPSFIFSEHVAMLRFALSDFQDLMIEFSFRFR